MACAILERTSGLEPSSETTAPRYLKLVTMPYFCPLTFISFWMPLALFVISLVFSALISILYLVQVLSRLSTRALWATMRKYNISANLVRTTEQLYDKATSAVRMNGSIGEWFRTTVGVRQGCLLSPTLFNIFLKRIMSDALEEHDGKVSIVGRNITNLRFADDIDALAEEEQELEALIYDST